jgi:hypothetical protein
MVEITENQYKQRLGNPDSDNQSIIFGQNNNSLSSLKEN